MSLPRYFIFVSCAIDVVFEVKEKVFSNIKKIVDLPDYFPMLNVDLSLKKASSLLLKKGFISNVRRCFN